MAERKIDTGIIPSKHSINDKKKQAILEQLWLTYYNDTLFAKGLITEEERNRMRVRIKNRTSCMER